MYEKAECASPSWSCGRGRTRGELCEVLRAVPYADDANEAVAIKLNMTKIISGIVEVCAASGLGAAEKEDDNHAYALPKRECR